MNEIDGHPVSLKQHMLLYSMKQPDAKLCLALHILPQISCKVPKMSCILNVKKKQYWKNNNSKVVHNNNVKLWKALPSVSGSGSSV